MFYIPFVVAIATYVLSHRYKETFITRLNTGLMNNVQSDKELKAMELMGKLSQIQESRDSKQESDSLKALISIINSAQSEQKDSMDALFRVADLAAKIEGE